ncbi:MAG: trigger factor [Thermodesulfobacteriota bacterium]|nr:trigger factor [Thermodesulfobacteriota bacterium]
MQVTVEDLSSVKKILHIEIPEEKVINELDASYKNLKKNAKVKGFRPGKTPRSVLKRMFQKDVHADVSSRLIQDSFLDALKETGLNMVGNPKVDPPGLEEKGPYKYNATIEISPEIEDLDFKGLTLKKTLYKISGEEVDAQLKMLQKSLAQQKTVEEDRPVKEGDFALIDYEGFKDGKPYAETQMTENFTLKVGNGQILKEFDSGMIGMKPSETREVKVTFPQDYFNAKLAGLDITFNIKLNEIREEVLPEIDDEMAKNLGHMNTLDELKKTITDNLTQGYEKRVEQELNEQIFKALIEKSDFEVPDTMVDYELEGIIAEAERSFASQNMSMEDMGLTREGLAEKYRDTALKQVKRHLILKKLIDQEKLTLSDEDLENGFKEMADSFNQPVEEIKNFYSQNKDKVEFFKHTLLEKQAIGLIIDSSTVEEVKPEAGEKPEKKESDKTK